MLRTIGALLALGSTCLLASPAEAACGSVKDELSCSSTGVTYTTTGSGSSGLEDYECGTPFSPLTQAGSEDVFSFFCQETGSVNLDITGLSCDFDIYVLDDVCDTSTRGCLEGSTKAGTSNDSITFSCTKGDTYHVVVEGYGYTIGDCSGTESYTLSFDMSSSTACSEDCNDSKDNDFDGDVDCADTDCIGDPVCSDPCDDDGDGYDSTSGSCGGTDCDDTDSSIHPGATEVCNSIDDDCDGSVDEGVSTTYYRDADRDGYGNPAISTTSCGSAPSGYVANDDDCNDSNKNVNPGRTETCNGIDDDCDGSIDEGLATTYYADTDGDGYGDASTSTSACSRPTGYVSNSTDCDDTDRNVNPGATEVCNGVDDDCDGSIDEGATNTYYRDADGDGYGDATRTTTGCSAPSGYVSNATDCNDSSASIYPTAPEVCNGIDDDCDGTIDDGVTNTYYRDFDKDGYGDPSTTTTGCSAPSGYVAIGTDCDDKAATVHPGATETCNGVDDDCDGTIDDGVGSTWYRDADGDGYGSTTTTVACTAPTGYTATPGDCNDSNSAVNPGATETCNGLDDDCDTSIDEGVKTTYYRDADGDGYGGTSTTTACSPPSGYVTTSTDCDDTAKTTYPGAPELCDGVDNDCDGSVDEGASGAPTWYADDDGDGYGDPSSTTTACTRPSGYVASSTDCDDAKPLVNPGADELCNGIDDDCDGTVDEASATDASTWYVDGDGDGYGGTGTTKACTKPTGYVATSTDCDDADADVHPGAPEVCNGVDDDCDGSVDDGVLNTYYRDADGDGHGGTTTTLACTPPTGYLATSDDCDDTDATTYPGASEICDGIDNDCDGSIDEGATGMGTWYADTDADGYGDPGASTASCSRPTGYVNNDDDCDDGDGDVNPGADELCNGKDDDCDGVTDESDATDALTWYVDGDTDGYGGPTTTKACTKPANAVATSTDCDDADSAVNPGASEVCNGVDDDCDGTVDDGVLTTYYRDADGDGHGGTGTTTGCTPPTGYVATSDDCDDADATTYTGAPELCDGIDNDCDGSIDEGASGTATWYADADSDGYGDPSTSVNDCVRPSGYVANGDDCADADATVNPGATERCNGKDDDCDGLTDEADADDALTFYADDDADGYGDLGAPTTACSAPSGYVADSTDCDDGNDAVNPGATEVCNGVDDNCDGTIDEAVKTTYYLDGDADGHGGTTTIEACAPPTGYVATSTDCDDADAAVNPDATEVCNGKDDDCDASVDEGVKTTFYADGDGDGYGDLATTTDDCSAPSGYVADSTDCDDLDGGVNPGADELCNGKDDDCDGLTDEADAIDADTWYADKDDDGFGDATDTSAACSAPSGYVGDATDCDDRDVTVYPGATEVPYDGIDQDCDGADLTDADGDGYDWDGVGGTDCDDSDALVNPDTAETADGVDENCDGTVDETTEYYDDDGDGYTESGGDCDDETADVSPTASEDCDAIDDDCDGTVDETTDCYDDDGDGFTEDGGDCNDGDAAVNPDVVEVADNGIDDDCDGSVDDGVYDPDGDGYTTSGGDCDNDDPNTYPGADEIADGADNDCDKDIDEGTEAYDDDGDGLAEIDGDCDDGNDSVYDGADEDPTNGVDDDCDGLVDEGGPNTDDDGDGFTEEGGDCDDADDAVNPGAEELDNDVDDDCDGEVDEDWDDADGDGYTFTDGDCDDRDGWTNPGALEVCDAVDNNCNGDVDEGCEDAGIVDPGRGKCGCASGGLGGAGVLPLLVGLLIRRRERR